MYSGIYIFRNNFFTLAKDYVCMCFLLYEMILTKLYLKRAILIRLKSQKVVYIEDGKDA